MKDVKTIIEELALSFLRGGEPELITQYKKLSPKVREACDLARKGCPTCEKLTVQIQGVCVLCHRRASEGKSPFLLKELRIKKDDSAEVATLISLFEASVQDTIKSEADCLLQEFEQIQRRYKAPARALAMVVLLTRSAEQYQEGLHQALKQKGD